MLKCSSSQSTKLLASSSITQGLSPGLANIAVLTGHLLVCILAMLNGYVGCKYGINFPVLMRSACGMYGAYIAVLIRAVAELLSRRVSGVGGVFRQCCKLMDRPADSHLTSAQLLCFFICIIIQLPHLWLHVSNSRFLFMSKSIIKPFVDLTLFVWALIAGKRTRIGHYTESANNSQPKALNKPFSRAHESRATHRVLS